MGISPKRFTGRNGRNIHGLFVSKAKGNSFAPPNSSGVFPGRRLFLTRRGRFMPLTERGAFLHTRHFEPFLRSIAMILKALLP